MKTFSLALICVLSTVSTNAVWAKDDNGNKHNPHHHNGHHASEYRPHHNNHRPHHNHHRPHHKPHYAPSYYAPSVMYTHETHYYKAPVQTIYAKVVSVSPITQTVTVQDPQQVCWDQQVPVQTYRSEPNATGAIVGGVLGGVLGHSVGNDRHSRGVGTVAGAAIGATIGSDIGSKHYESTEYRNEKHCNTHYQTSYREQVVGYNVGYLYGGQVLYTRTNSHPGNSIQVTINLNP